MTFAELQRFFDSKERVKKEQEQQRASFDYILADLIGRSVSRIYNSANKMPTIDAVYPDLFEAAEVSEKQQAKKDELSALRFKMFAQAHNSNRKEVVIKDE